MISALIQLLYAIIVGLVQGIAEWLPISSKTQVLIVSTYLFNLTYQQAYTFGLFMEIGTVAAAVIYFRKELASLVRALLWRGTESEKAMLKYVVIATIITGIIGAPLYLIADSITGVSVGIPMLIIGFILIGDAFLIRHSKMKQKLGKNTRKFADLSTKDYILIGLAQGIAALPGVSRSGITVSTMLLMNVEPDEAFRLSFIIGIFAALAAFALTLIVSHANINAALSAIGLTGLAVAIVTSAIISLFLIDYLIKVAGKSNIVYLTAALGLIALASGSIFLITGA